MGGNFSFENRYRHSRYKHLNRTVLSVPTLFRSRGISVFGVPVNLQNPTGSLPRGRTHQARTPRGITLEIRIGHSLAAPV